MTGKYGFALFGAGRAGTIHLKFLTNEPKVDLMYLVDDDNTKWDQLRTSWNLVKVKFLTSADAAIVYKDPKVRAVVIASPTFTHEDIVKQALTHNKAVFCEKPIADSLDKVRACFERARRVNQPLLTGFNRRFDPSFASIKERVQRGELGHVRTVKVCSRDSPRPSMDYLKISHGIFHDCAVHDIDMTIYVLGEYPTRVSVVAKANIPEIAAIDDYDTVGILLSFPSGVVGMIDVNRHSTYGYDQRLEVFGEMGMLKAENQSPVYNVETYTDQGVKKSPIDYSFPTRYAEGYVNELRHFLNVIEGKAEIGINYKDTLAVSRIASACEEAVRTGNTVEIKWSKEDLPSRRLFNNTSR